MKKNKKKMVLLPPLKRHVPNYSQLDQLILVSVFLSPPPPPPKSELDRSLWFWGMLFLAQMGFGVERVLRVRVVLSFKKRKKLQGWSYEDAWKMIHKVIIIYYLIIILTGNLTRSWLTWQRRLNSVPLVLSFSATRRH